MQTAGRLGFGIALFMGLSVAVYAADIEGDYIETRSADVYTGPCFANGEVGLLGNQAILAWHVREGRWGDVALDGLTVVGVVRAAATLGDVYSDPYPAKSVLLIDETANEEQRTALVQFARAMGGRLLSDVVEVRAAPISLQVGTGEEHGSALLTAGNLVKVRTRSLGHKDHFCGNEITYYPPLTGQLSHSMPVFALANEYSGPGLDSQWRLRNRRSAFIGTFATRPELSSLGGSQ
jgi:hypothetical protein